MNKHGDLGDEEGRIRLLEARTARTFHLAVFQQVLLVVLLAFTYLSWGTANADSLDALYAKLDKLELQGSKMGTFNARLDELDHARIKHDARLEVLERGTLSHALETRETLRQLGAAVSNKQQGRRLATSGQPRINERQLEAGESEDRATIRVDAPDGVAQFVMGAHGAADNVVMQKEHADNGGEFTLSRNDTRVLSVQVDGALTVHNDPLQVPSAVASAPGAPLELRSSDPGAGVALQDQQTAAVDEVDGTATWSAASVLVYTGDTVHWSWTNYHNVVEINAAGVIVSGGIRSGDPELDSSFAYTFSQTGAYLFKSQAEDDMRMTVEVREFAVRNGTLNVGGDLDVSGHVRVGGNIVHGPGFEQEVKFFLGGECPPGWTVATETEGKIIASSGSGLTAGTTTGAISATASSIDTSYYYHSSYYYGCTTYSAHKCSQTATPSVTISAPGTMAMLACKRA